jgi:ATP-dependent Clp protease ATP-binding subunit ClpC
MTREGLKKRGIKLAWTQKLVNHLARQGFSTRLGARPLQRTIESLIVAPLASHLNRDQTLRNAELSLDLDDDNQVIITP